MKKVITAAVASCLFVCASGCAIFYDYTALPSGHYWPKRPAWSVVPNTTPTTSHLDIRAVYLRRRSDDWCHIYRFWPSGRVMLKSLPYPPSLESIDDLSRSYLGYYRIESGSLFIETYGPAGSPAMKGGYSKRVFEITESSVIKLSGDFNGHNYQDFTKYDMKYRKYEKYPIAGMKTEPFW
jgi:hypothetical protein